jgi:hypothetical protein
VGDIKAMTLEDLEYIFANQIAEGTEKLYFMLVDLGNMPIIERHPTADLEGLLPMLSHFQYAGLSGARMPRFVK